MSIDAKIREVTETVDGYLILDLEPRWSSRDHTWSLPGQKQLTIEKPYTWVPEPGLEIWGGDGIVLIETKPKPRHYWRTGYSRLVEKG
ncbi:MAG TPA: hypothetical protein VHV10_16670 [Ktedonobacteraceae bacterium]|jgi:hypothetical protein|nr:hypothetical protein [Ktedonobacteraceae bacterium]